MRKAQQAAQLRVQLVEQQTQEEHVRRVEQECFLAMLGHELRNPLAAVGLLADTHTEEGRQIRRAVDDMAQVLERSVQSGRLQDASLAPQRSSFDMHALMHDICTRSERLALLNFAPATTVCSDHLWLRTVLGNLVDNALKYSPPDSPVQVHCSRRAQHGRDALCVRVSNAPGVAGLPDPAQLFQKYYRSPKARRQIGSGLGLYLSKSLLDMLGAHIVYLPPSGNEAQHVVFEVDIPMAGTQA